MLSFGAYTALVFGSVLFIILIGAIILLKLPLPKFVRLLEKVFGFTQVRIDDNNIVILDVCGDNFELTKTLSSRLPFAIALGMSLLVSILLFVNECIFSSRHIYSTKVCSERIPNCYLFKSRFTSLSPFYQYVCQPNEPVIPLNMTVSYAQCYGFVLLDQTTIDIINQLGTCTSILWLVENAYPLLYKLGHYYYGRICLLLFTYGIIVLQIVFLAIQINISFLTVILLVLTAVLLGSILYLHYRKQKNPVLMVRLESEVELN